MGNAEQARNSKGEWTSGEASAHSSGVHNLRGASLETKAARPKNTATRERIAINQGTDARHFPSRYR
jgi:hypothetical protein